MYLLLLLTFFVWSTIQEQAVFTTFPHGWVEPFTYEWVQLLEQFHNAFGNRTKKDTCLFPIPKFDCQPFLWEDSIVERDAYHLRPQDIKSVIAIGDSITAGFGMMSGRPPFSTVVENRGKVFSIGGDMGEYTLPNFLSIYASELHGSPEGYTFPLSRGKDLSRAVTGAKTQDLNSQVNQLVHHLNRDYKDIKDQWKIVTLFIGANNVCVLCTPPFTTLPVMAEADQFEKNVRSALSRLQSEAGKVYVNLVGLFNVSSVYEASRGDPYCENVLDPSHMVICSCIQHSQKQRDAADRMIDEYNKRLQKLEKEFKYQQKETFGVSYQPAFTQFPVAKYKQAYFSGIDCFHPNRCANQVMAILLWNNMFSNSSQKREEFDVQTLTIRCPNPTRPYIQ
ncbi:GDSL-like Lipase/Acylhydrolase-domain-containing protein [Sporodiniella umbellata]|nr:GDSL-like Lipase/Acylhydrolase-domain-containing protein [Sporodiniella umbellata]